MKTSLILSAILIFLCLPGCQPASDQHQAKKTRVGLVFDVGGLGDKSFNDSAYRGLVKAGKELGVECVYYEPGEVADREAGLRRLAQSGFDLMFGIGFIFTDDLNMLAREYRRQKFGGIDYTISYDQDGRPIPPPPNLVALKFKEEEGSFLVGALCALKSRTGVIGFLGGMDIPLIHKFEAGYIAGAKLAKPQINVLVSYTGVTPEAFKDPGRGKELSLGMFNSGADIIYHAAGATGLGLFEAAKVKDKLAVGVDSDQYYEMPGYVLTSMVKRVDVAVYRTVKDYLEGRFQGGIENLGLKEDGVDYVYDDHNRDLIPKDIHDRVEEIRRQIVSGQIAAPSNQEELKNFLKEKGIE